jgi:hypothetical protein
MQRLFVSTSLETNPSARRCKYVSRNTTPRLSTASSAIIPIVTPQHAPPLVSATSPAIRIFVCRACATPSLIPLFIRCVPIPFLHDTTILDTSDSHPIGFISPCIFIVYDTTTLGRTAPHEPSAFSWLSQHRSSLRNNDHSFGVSAIYFLTFSNLNH